MKKYIKPTSPKKSAANQPTKDGAINTKKNTPTKTKNNAKQKIYKSQNITPSKKGTVKEIFIRCNDTPKERKHPEYGTSKLEERFAKDFLDKLGVVYQTQFKAESIGRYYDFYLPASNTIIECDGDYFHSYGLLYEEMSPMQKKNKRVDEAKDKWAREHGINLIRIWEHDINKNPNKVIQMLKEKLSEYSEKYKLEQNKKKRPNIK